MPQLYNSCVCVSWRLSRTIDSLTTVVFAHTMLYYICLGNSVFLCIVARVCAKTLYRTCCVRRTDSMQPVWCVAAKDAAKEEG